MHGLRRLLPIWSLLPSFRVVGEDLHLPSAAAAAETSPSSLSRAIAKLERGLGQPLFRRAGRRLVLTDRGAAFLDAVREAMRLVDTACEELQTDALRGKIRIASSGVATASLVLPTILGLAADHPALEPEFSSDLTDLPARLSSGRLDLALVTTVMRAPRLRCEKVGDVPTAIYCGPTHPLLDRAALTLEELEAFAFIAPPADAEGNIRDGWPIDRPRRVALVVDQMRVGAEACLVAPLLAVLPVTIGDRFRGLGLSRLPVRDLPPTTLYAWIRRRLGKPTIADRVLERLLDSHRADHGGEPGGRSE